MKNIETNSLHHKVVKLFSTIPMIQLWLRFGKTNKFALHSTCT